MKKLILLSLLASGFFLSNCKKKSVIEEVKPIPEIPIDQNGNLKYLKNITVAGAEPIIFDSLNNAYIVTLPQSYTDKEINVNLSMYDGVEVLYSSSPVTNDTTIKFFYQGQTPLRFELGQDKSRTHSYTIYVTASGSPKIELSYSEIPITAGLVHFPLNIISGVGTLPNSPQGAGPIIRLADRKAGTSVQGNVQPTLTSIYLQEIEKLINWDNLSLEIQFENQKPIVFDFQFKRALPGAYLNDISFIHSLKDTLLIFGGYFSPSEKYTAKFSNDFSPPISLEMSYNSLSMLSSELKGNIPEGSYLASFYEGDKIIGKSAIYAGNSVTKSIETIWKEDANNVFNRNTNELSFNKGDTFYAKTSPPQFAYGSKPASSFDSTLVPYLQLKNGLTIINLKPEITAVNWAIAGLSFSFGKYKIPENISSGSYEVSPIFTDKKELKPYWSKMEIR